MKIERHSAIRTLIGEKAIASQDELRRKLLRRGFDVTQATLSRDIHEMRLAKGPNGYELPSNGTSSDADEPSLKAVLSGFGLGVAQALNQLVLKTTAGAAQPVANALDREGLEEVVGTLAGDDTVLIICPDQKRASHLRNLLEEAIG
jgi:transcriptional regulator of arginine metabolism